MCKGKWTCRAKIIAHKLCGIYSLYWQIFLVIWIPWFSPSFTSSLEKKLASSWYEFLSIDLLKHTLMLGTVQNTLQTLAHLVPITQCQIKWASLFCYTQEVTEPQEDSITWSSQCRCYEKSQAIDYTLFISFYCQIVEFPTSEI